MTRADMTCDQAIDVLHAELDGEISAEQRALLQSHLQRCASCASLREDMVALVGAAARLPRERPPERDLWAGIRARIEAPRSKSPREQGAGGRHRPLWAWAGSLAMAAAALAALSLAWQGLQGGAPSGAPPDLQAEVAAWETEVRGATDELLAALEARRDELDPETLAVVRRNLRIIDQAIEETRAVLADKPQDEAGRAALAALHQHKLQLLRQVVDLPRSG